MKLVIHTLGWKADMAKQPGEEANVSIHCLLEIDGQLIPEVTRVAVVMGSDEFTKVVATLAPGELETVVHDKDAWERLCEQANYPRRAEYRRRLWHRRSPH